MKLPQSEIKKIAILRALQLGDMLCSIPAIRALRAAYPEAEITLLGLPWAASFVQRFDMYIDRFVHFPGYEGLPEQEYEPALFERFSRDMKAERFDLLLQMQGDGTFVNSFIEKLGARYTAGFHNMSSFTDNPLFTSYPDYGHEAERHLILMEFLGIPSLGIHLEFPFTAKDHKELKNLPIHVVPKKYVCIHPGSRGAWRQWPPRLFAALADYCYEKNLQVVITGTADEQDIAKELQKCARHTLTNLTGQTSLGTVALLIKNARLLIANCTGVSHIASAVKTPGVIISMDGETERWAPQNKQLHKTIDWTTNPNLPLVFSELEALLNSNKKTFAMVSR